MDKKQLSKLAIMGLVVAASGSLVEGNAAEGTLLAGSCGGKGKCGGTVSYEDGTNYHRSGCAGSSNQNWNARPQSSCANAQNPNQAYSQRNNSCAGQTYRYTADNTLPATTPNRNAQNNSYNTNRNFQDNQSEYYNYPNSSTERNYNTSPNAYNSDYYRANMNQQNPTYPGQTGGQPEQNPSSMNPSSMKNTSKGY